MNIMVVRPGLAIVDKRQVEMIRLLERHGIDVIPLQLTHSRVLRGGFHCSSLDVRRTGDPAVPGFDVPPAGDVGERERVRRPVRRGVQRPGRLVVHLGRRVIRCHAGNGQRTGDLQTYR